MSWSSSIPSPRWHHLQIQTLMVEPFSLKTKIYSPPTPEARSPFLALEEPERSEIWNWRNSWQTWEVRWCQTSQVRARPPNRRRHECVMILRLVTRREHSLKFHALENGMVWNADIQKVDVTQQGPHWSLLVAFIPFITWHSCHMVSGHPRFGKSLSCLSPASRDCLSLPPSFLPPSFL